MIEWRLAAALPIAGVVAGAAWRAGSLTASGALAAAVIGGIAVAAGWPWAVLLLSLIHI